MSIKPLADRVLVKPVDEGELKRGSIYIPETAKERPMQGDVVDIGVGRVDDNGKLVPMVVKKGDRVLFGVYSGNEIEFGGEKFLMMRETDIFAIVDEGSLN